MKVLKSVVPTAEQLKIISTIEPRIEVIRGAAGSGKTTTAILRLRGYIGTFSSQRRRSGSQAPLRMMVLTYNRTLRGYIEQLINEQVRAGENVQIEVNTFARWANHLLGGVRLLEHDKMEAQIASLRKGIPLDSKFLTKEVEYVLGLFMPEDWDSYLDVRRTGRGSPGLDRPTRKCILDQVIRPYADWKRTNGYRDWMDIEVQVARERHGEPYDCIIADETQDFSANQIRAVLKHLANPGAATFILDTAQRIYSRGFSWKDVGVILTSANSHRLTVNYRNTKEIAALAIPLVRGIADADTDASIPDLNACKRTGRKPELYRGKFSAQLAQAIDFIRRDVDLTTNSVAFLQPMGGGWFNTTRDGLKNAGLRFVELTRETDWPTGPENIALCTISSAKGLEFDHVFLLGLCSENLFHGAELDDDEFLRLRRLLAMGICRARETVVLGAKPGEASDLLDLLEPATYKEILL